MALPQTLTREIVEYAFSDVYFPYISTTRKHDLKKILMKARSQELGRKLKRCMNETFGTDATAISHYLKGRSAYDNAVITMIILLASDKANAILSSLSNISGPFTAKQIEEILARPAITDVNRRLNDFVKTHKDNVIITLPSGRVVHVSKTSVPNSKSLYWKAQVIERSLWISEKVISITLSYPTGFDIKKFSSTTPIIANALVNYAPMVFYSEAGSNMLDIYFMHHDYVSHSRYLIDRHGVAKIFELRALKDGVV